MYSENDDEKRVTREWEIELSKLDNAAQGFALSVKGAVIIYDHDKPIRSVEFTMENGLWGRIFIDPIEARCYALGIELSKISKGRRYTWHTLHRKLAAVPESFSDQFLLFEECLSIAKNVPETSLILIENPSLL